MRNSIFYDRVINKYFALPEGGGMFKGAIYRPFIYKVGLDNSLFDVKYYTLNRDEQDEAVRI
ncbi:MAG: hypothetical protein ACK415_12060 [Thermodesulfovibrionales bacterium]